MVYARYGRINKQQTTKTVTTAWRYHPQWAMPWSGFYFGGNLESLTNLKWFRVATGFTSDERIRYIRALPDGTSIAWLYICLLDMGMRRETDVIYVAQTVPYTAASLAEACQINESTVEMGLAILEKLGMVHCKEDGGLYLDGFRSFQELDKLEDRREAWREKKQRQRAKEKALPVPGDMPGTSPQCPAMSPLETETETEPEHNKTKNIVAPQADATLSQSPTATDRKRRGKVAQSFPVAMYEAVEAAWLAEYVRRGDTYTGSIARDRSALRQLFLRGIQPDDIIKCIRPFLSLSGDYWASKRTLCHLATYYNHDALAAARAGTQTYEFLDELGERFG